MHWSIVFSLTFNIMTTACCVAAIASSDWINNFEETVGIFRQCNKERCSAKILLVNTEMVSSIFLCFAIVSASANCFMVIVSFCFEKEIKRTLMTLLSYIGFVCLLISGSVYTAYAMVEFRGWSFGWGFVITWCSVGLSLLAAISAQVKDRTPPAS